MPPEFFTRGKKSKGAVINITLQPPEFPGMDLAEGFYKQQARKLAEILIKNLPAITVYFLAKALKEATDDILE